MCKRLRSLVIYGCATILRCGAEIYDLHSADVVANMSLQGLYLFYVGSASPGRPLPTVEFANLALSGSDSGGVEVSVMKYGAFVDSIDPNRFCFPPRKKLLLKNARAGQALYSHRVFSTAMPVPAKHVISSAGVYILLLTNCADTAAGVVKGQVTVKHAYGYLPAAEHDKLRLHLILSVVYAVLWLVWSVLSLRWWKSLTQIQKGIGGILFISVAESVLWYAFLWDWNDTGRRRTLLFVVAAGVGLVRSMSSYMLVLAVSLGWGVTLPQLKSSTGLKIEVVGFMYILFASVLQCVLSFWYSRPLPFVYVAICMLLASLMNFVIFSWALYGLSVLKSSLRKQGQTEKAVVVGKLGHVLAVAVFLGAIALLQQVLDLTRDIAVRGWYQWIFNDAVNAGICLVVLVRAMLLWRPRRPSDHFVCSATAYDDETAVFRETIFGDGDLAGIGEDPDDDDESFWAATREENLRVGEDGNGHVVSPGASVFGKGLSSDGEK